MTTRLAALAPLCLVCLLALGCPSSGLPATEAAAVESQIPDPLPSEPNAMLDVLLGLPFEAHFGDPLQRATSSQRLLGAIDLAMRASDDPARFAAVQAASAMVIANPTDATYRALVREWESLRPGL